MPAQSVSVLASARPKISTSSPHVGESPAQLRDAGPDAGGAARRMGGEQADLHSGRCASARTERLVEPGRLRRRAGAVAARTACIRPSANRSGPQSAMIRLAGLAHRLALPVGHGGDPVHQPGELLDVTGIEGEAVDAVPHEIRGATAAVRDEHRQARRHGLVDHEAPLLGGAGVDEGAREAVEGRQLVVLPKAAAG